MDTFEESYAKDAIRSLLLDGTEALNRSGLTYLGLPGGRALDIIKLDGILKNVICVDDKESVLDEARRAISNLRLKQRKFVPARLWEYLRDQYPREELVADVAFLDFLGGGIVEQDPFAQEIAGLRSYFAKHARQRNRAFVLAWTYMPHDRGPAVYTNTLKKIVNSEDIQLLQGAKGVQLRSLAIRLLLRQSLVEHDMDVKLFHHALYKRVMNTIIVIYSKGRDSNLNLVLESPDSLLTEPCCVYAEGQPVPKLMPVLELSKLDKSHK